MNLLTRYALAVGAKVDEPFIYESFFPLPSNKYITIQTDGNCEAKNYAYFQDVIDIINPILLKNHIDILHIGKAGSTVYHRVMNLLGQTNQHQLAYLLNRSSLHIGPDDVATQIVAQKNIPSVTVYGNCCPEVCGPVFGEKNLAVSLTGYDRIGNKKPSYSANENPKSINLIKPEEVAAAVFKLLNIDFEIPFETVYTGDRYSAKIIRELVPDFQGFIESPEQPIEIRYDMNPDIKLLAHYLGHLKVAAVITNQPIDINFLRQMKKRIQLIAYEINENDNPQFVKEVSGLGIPLILTSKMSDEKIQEKKINYYEHGLINKSFKPNKDKVEELRKDIDKLYYRSCKITVSNNETFYGQSGMKNKAALSNNVEYQKVIDCDEFWNEMEFLTIIKKK